jgi:hypothetical protein
MNFQQTLDLHRKMASWFEANPNEARATLFPDGQIWADFWEGCHGQRFYRRPVFRQLAKLERKLAQRQEQSERAKQSAANRKTEADFPWIEEKLASYGDNTITRAVDIWIELAQGPEVGVILPEALQRFMKQPPADTPKRLIISNPSPPPDKGFLQQFFTNPKFEWGFIKLPATDQPGEQS